MAYNSAYTGPQIDASVAAVTQNANSWTAKQNAIQGNSSQVAGFAGDGTLAPVTMNAVNVLFAPMEPDGSADVQGAIEDAYRQIASLPDANVAASAFQTFYNGGGE